MAEGLRGEVEAAREPEEAFGRGVGFAGGGLGEFGADEGLEGGGGERGGELAVADLFDVAGHVGFHRGEGDGAEEVWWRGGRS